MTETERMLTQTLKRLEDNAGATLKEFSTRLERLEEEIFLLELQLPQLNDLFNSAQDIFSRLLKLLQQKNPPR